MKRLLAWLVLGSLVAGSLSAHGKLSAGASAALSRTSQTKLAKTSVAPQAETVAAATATPTASPQRFAIGVGYPDVRMRVAVGAGIDLEAKVALADQLQVYSGRLYWTFAHFGPVGALIGAEGGVVSFNGQEGLSGNGTLAEGFLGFELPIGSRLRVTVDAGPAWASANASGQTYSTTDLVYNTALYLFIF